MNRIILFLLYLLLYLLLFFGYFNYVYPMYKYAGFSLDLNRFKLFEGIVLLAFVVILLPDKFRKPSDVLLHIQFLVPIFPMLILYCTEDWPRIFLWSVVLLFVGVIIFVEYVRMPAVRIASFSPTIMIYLIFFVVALYIGSIFQFGGARFLNFNIAKVYEYRSEAAAILPGMYGYFSPMLTKVLLPFLLVLSIVEKKWFLVFSAVVASILMFGLTSHKAPLFYPFAVLSIFFFLQKKNVIAVMVFGCLVVVFISTLGFEFGGYGSWIGSLFIRRTFFVPAQLNFIYNDFFSSHPYVMWAGSKLTLGLIKLPYDLNIPHLIGLEYYSNSETAANTGWIGSGYAHFGFVGMFLYSVIIAALLSFLNAYSKRLNKNIVVAFAVVPLLSVFSSSDLTTSFLTHGVILTLFLCTLFTLDRSS